MNIPKKFNLAAVVVTIAMVVILPLLAYLQYTWLGELSRQEYKRMQDNIRMAAFHCSMEASMDMTEAMRTLAGPLAGPDEVITRTVRERIVQWRGRTSSPALLMDEVRITEIPQADRVVRIAANERTSLYVMRDLSAIGIDIQGRPGSAAFVTVDTGYFSTSYITRIIQSHFSSVSISSYDIAVTDDAHRSIWSTVGIEPSTLIATADIVEPLVRFPPMPLSSIPKEVRRDGPGGGRPGEHDGGPGYGDMRRAAGPDGGERIGNARGLFHIHVRHHDGSLETAVNRNRMRSLAISFSVLVLLGSSVVFLLISAGRAQRLAQQQMEFVAGVSHELRTPLAVLKAAGENLADGVIRERERAQQYGDLIKKEVTRLSEMVEKALTYAGIQSGRLAYELQPTHIGTVIEEAVAKMQRLIVNDDAVINVETEPGLPEILGDADALQSAIENLTLNAVKYSGGKIRIGVDARRTMRGRASFVQITVTDKGMGIAREDIGNVFKPFYRARNAVDGQIQGNGLGLSITKHIIDAHRGRITVTSTLNAGSTFTILLPFPPHEGVEE